MLSVLIILYCFYYARDKAFGVPKTKSIIKTKACNFFGLAYSNLEWKVVTICVERCYCFHKLVTEGIMVYRLAEKGCAIHSFRLPLLKKVPINLALLYEGGF